MPEKISRRAWAGVGFAAGLGLGIVVLVAGVWAQLGVANPATLRLRDMVTWKKAAAARVTGPKILICAGSSALLGLRADLIGQTTGTPTINLGVAAALGMPTCCAWAEELAQPGDTILLAFEYDLYDWRDWSLAGETGPAVTIRYNVEYVDYLLAYEPEHFRSLSWREQVKVVANLPNKRWLDGLSRALLEPRSNPGGAIPRPADLDDWGDELHATADRRPLEAGLQDVVDPLVHGLPEHPAGFIYLHHFIAQCHKRGIRVLATWPNLLFRPEYLQPVGRATAVRIEQFFQREGVPVLGRYEEALLPKEQFFDTVYHLVEPAAMHRTERLLAQWPQDPRFRPPTFTP